MGWFLVLVIAVAVGSLVYALTGGGEPVRTTEGSTTGGRGSDAAAGTVPVPSDAAQWSGASAEIGAGPDVGGGVVTGGPGRIQLSPDTDPIPVVRARPSWHSRLNGVMGLVVAIAFGAIAIAGAFYGIGRIIAKLVTSAR
jgi:hypothetical protein